MPKDFLQGASLKPTFIQYFKCGELHIFHIRFIDGEKHPLQNRTNVLIKGGGGQRPFEQCSKKTSLFLHDGFPYQVTLAAFTILAMFPIFLRPENVLSRRLWCFNCRYSSAYKIYVLADYDVRDTGKRYSSRRPPSPGTVTSPGSIWLPVMLLPAETQNWSQPALILDIFLSQTLPFLPSLYVLSPLLLSKWGDLLNSPLRAAICPLKKRRPPPPMVWGILNMRAAWEHSWKKRKA